MKYTNIILTIIVIFLITISLRLVHLAILLTNFNENVQFLTNAHQELLQSNKRLEKKFAELKQEINLKKGGRE